jgi:hypothetical protein
MQRWAPPDVFCEDDPAVATTTMHDRRLAERRPSCSVGSQASTGDAARVNMPLGSSGNNDVQIDDELDEYRRLVGEIAGSTAGAQIRMYHGKPTSACGVLVSRAVAVGRF